MDTNFNMPRLGKLISNEYYVNNKKILLGLGMMLGIALAYFGIAAVSRVHAGTNFTSTLFFLLILIFQGIMINTCFSEFSSKPKTQTFLLIPASKLEKFVAKFSYCMVIFPLIFLLYHFLVVEMSFIYNGWATKVFHLTDVSGRDGASLERIYRMESVTTMVTVWFFAASAFLCGAQYFKKRSHTKTVLIVLAFIILCVVIIRPFYLLASGHMPTMSVPFLYIGEFIDGKIYSSSFIDVYHYAIHWLGLFVSLYLIVVSWVKFNEKTV